VGERRPTVPPRSLTGPVADRLHRGAVAILLAVASGLAAPSLVLAQPAAVAAEPEGEELIAVVRTNGVRRGEFTLLRRPDQDFWIAREDLDALQLEPQAVARRELGGRTYYSARSLGARKVDFDEALLTLSIDFAPESLQQTVVDVGARRARPAAPTTGARGASLILSYRLSALRNFDTQAHRAVLEDELAVRVGPILLRQETTVDTGATRRFARGASQAIWDDLPHARRWTFGDVVSTAGAYGSTITGAGLLLTKFYDLAPDLIRRPVATLQAATPLPAQVELSVDGNTIYRTEVGPGPITLTNVAVPGGRQNVRMTVTDVSGRRQVIEQPFFFTDAALGEGFHEYSYFVGKR
jgi:outer membrane usher protein